MKKNLWVKLISVILIVASVVTLSACESVEEESGLNSDSEVKDVIITTRAEDLPPSKDLTFTLTSDKKSYQLKSVSKCKDEQIVIPASYTGADGKALPVTAIAVSAFKDNKTAVTVYIPDSVTKISGGVSGAFEGAKSLTTVVCGSGITEIGNRAFADCGNLKKVQLREGIKKIGSYAFAGCKELETITIPDSVEHLGEAAFQRCAKMTSVTLGKGLKKASYTPDTKDKNGKVVKMGDYKSGFGKFTFYFCKNISTIKYTGTMAEWKKVDIDVSCFLSTTMTTFVICSDGNVELPKLEGQNELPQELVDSFN